MICEFLQSYKRVRVGDEVKIKDKFLSNSYGLSAFIEYIKTHGNQFTVREITKLDKEILFEFWEIHGILYYDQIEPLGKARVVNCKKKP